MRRGGIRKFWRRVADKNRSSPSSSASAVSMSPGTLVPVPPFWPNLTISSEAAFTRNTLKNSDVGTKIENSRVGRLEPSGTSSLLKKGVMLLYAE